MSGRPPYNNADRRRPLSNQFPPIAEEHWRASERFWFLCRRGLVVILVVLVLVVVVATALFVAYTASTNPAQLVF